MHANWKNGFRLAAAVLLIVAPLLLPTYPKILLTEILIFGLFAASIDLLAGMVGRTSLGHGAIFGTAAYVVAWCQLSAGMDVWLASALGVLGASVLALVFGVLAVRTAGVYFLLLTLALGMVVWGVAYRWVSVTGAESGLRGIARPDMLVDHNMFYWFVLLVVSVVFGMMRFLVHSQFGLALRAIRESPAYGNAGLPRALCAYLGVSGVRRCRRRCRRAGRIPEQLCQPHQCCAYPVRQGAADGNSWRYWHVMGRLRWRCRHDHTRKRRQLLHRTLGNGVGCLVCANDVVCTWRHYRVVE